MHSAENTGDVRCLTDAPLPFFVRVGLPVCVGIIFAAAGTGIVGMAAFGEPADPFRLSGLGTAGVSPCQPSRARARPNWNFALWPCAAPGETGS